MDRSQFEVDRRRRTVYDLAGCYRRAGAADRHQGTAAASAYETAFAATVPPPLIVATGACWQHSSLRISSGRTLRRPLQLRLTTPRCGAHDAAVVYSYAGASANGVTSNPVHGRRNDHVGGSAAHPNSSRRAARPLFTRAVSTAVNDRGRPSRSGSVQASAALARARPRSLRVWVRPPLSVCCRCQPPGTEQRRRQALRLRRSSPALQFRRDPLYAGRRVARFAGPTVDRMAANQTRAEQQLIRDEHCLMRNE